MIDKFSLPLFLLLLAGCHPIHDKNPKNVTETDESSEIALLYSAPESKMMYSEAVGDSFRIFTAVPQSYGKDTLKYPLILILDANAYFESVLAELKLGTLTQDYPKSIVAGIGYKNFYTMDSLRDRDYTFPKALASDSFNVSGGAQRFKQFIDKELLPVLKKQYSIKSNEIILMGHSLGGYFALHYLLDSFERKESNITRFIAASPSLHYHENYLLELEKKSGRAKAFPFKLYLSSGTLERDPKHKEDLFQAFQDQLKKYHPQEAQVRYDEYSHFDHMDAAMPGFMKGLIFVFEK